MTHLSHFTAVRYRGISGLSLPLSRANLVTGVNGIGKTALIEAIWLFMGRYNPMLLWNANVHRTRNGIVDPVTELSNGALELRGVEDGSAHTFRTVFEKVADVARPVTNSGTRMEDSRQLPVIGRIDTYIDGELAKGRIGGMQPTPRGSVLHENPTSPQDRHDCVILISPGKSRMSNEYYLHRYSDMVRDGHKRTLKNAINLILPKIDDIEMLTDDTDHSYLSAMTDTGVRLPLHALGGGVVRIYHLLLSLFAAQGGILLVDEMENGIHHSVLQEIWSYTRRWIHEWNVQFLATTHSAECIDAAMDAFADAPGDLSIHKLFMNSETGRIEAATFTDEALEGARDLHLEVR